jgi:hypothetical protein
VDDLSPLASLTPALAGTSWFLLVSDLFIPVQPGPQNAWRSGILLDGYRRRRPG